MAKVIIPESLARLFPGAPRRCEIPAASVDELLRELDRRWPGMRDRLVDGRPAIRQHIILFVNGERAELATPLGDNDEFYVMPALSGG